jgi:curved DNA-binding protein CbpA
MTDGIDAYAILMVHPDAEPQIIKAAYRALARQFHPDLAGPSRMAEMQQLNVAWNLVRDPARRADYDADRREILAEAVAAGSGTSAAGRSSGAPGRRSTRFTRQPPPGTGSAGPPPGRPSGTVLDFGRFIGWSFGEIARVDPGYLEWLEHKREGRPHLAEIDEILRAADWRRDPETRHSTRRRRGRKG